MHAVHMKAIQGGKSKNDKIDSFKIAKVIRGDTFWAREFYDTDVLKENHIKQRCVLKNLCGFRSSFAARKTVDSIIATFCIQNKLSLLHSDKDFKPFHKHLRLKNAI